MTIQSSYAVSSRATVLAFGLLFACAELPALASDVEDAAASTEAAASGTRLLPKVLRGREALSALGPSKLPMAAQRSGLSEARMQEVLKSDQSAWVDQDGYLYYVDPPAPPPSRTAGEQAPAAPLFPLDETFWLHSRLGAKRVIYLDFDGQRYAKGATAWNPGKAINAPPFSLDGDTATFNDTELTRIQEIWQRVANDYAIFDVDVTTEKPVEGDIRRNDSSDQRYGTRAVITKEAALPGGCGCGGVAYVGTYDESSQHEFYQPAWVFFDNLAGGDAKSVAEATSHEVGHNLGLSHDGTVTGCADDSGGNTAACGYYEGHGSGPTGWAPIMGVGYSRQLTQWSKGEYPNASNTEDDFAVMTSHGAIVSKDDYPVAIAAGYPSLQRLGGQVSGGNFVVDQAGRIERPTDRDYFAFDATAGALQISAEPLSGPGVNLDISLKLFDSNGQQLPSTENDPQALGVGLSIVNLPAGSYYLMVQGTGDDDPAPGYTSYGSVGDYRLQGTIPSRDVTPDAFGFSDVTNAALDTPVFSEYVSISGLDGDAPISISGTTSAYQIQGQALTSAAGTVRNGDKVRVRLKSSTERGATRSLTLTVGGFSTAWAVTTTAPDTTPDAFSFTNVSNAALDTAVFSEYVTISGLEVDVPINVSGNTSAYQILGQTLTSAAGTVHNGDKVRVRLKSAATSHQARSLTLTVGSFSAGWTVTTQ